MLEHWGCPLAVLGTLELPWERAQSSLLEGERKGSQTLAKSYLNIKHTCEAILDHPATADLPAEWRNMSEPELISHAHPHRTSQPTHGTGR